MRHGFRSGLEEIELWVIEEITALYRVWFSFKLRGIVFVIGAAVKTRNSL